MKSCVVPAQSGRNFSMWTFMSCCVKLQDYFFQISVFWPLEVIYKNPALSPLPLASPMIRWIWLCSQLSRSKSPQPGLLTSSWFLFRMLLFACWSVPWDGAQLNEEKWKHGAMPDSFAAVLLIMKDECDSGQTDKNGNAVSLMCSTSGSFFGALVLPQDLWEEQQHLCRQELVPGFIY